MTYPTPPQTPILITDDETSSSRQGGGSLQFPELTGTPIYQRESNTSWDNLSVVTQDTSTGSSWSPSPRRRLFDSVNYPFLNPPTANQQDQTQQGTTSGSRRPALEKYVESNKEI